MTVNSVFVFKSIDAKKQNPNIVILLQDSFQK